MRIGLQARRTTSWWGGALLVGVRPGRAPRRCGNGRHDLPGIDGADRHRPAHARGGRDVTRSRAEPWRAVLLNHRRNGAFPHDLGD